MQNGGTAEWTCNAGGETNHNTNLPVSFSRKYADDNQTLSQLRTSIELIARLLEYPGEGMINRSIPEELDKIVPKPEIKRGILGFLTEIKKESLSRLRREYVSLFDFSDKTTLNLTYHMFGEERDRTQKVQRGGALLLLKSLYSESGFQPSNIELPDYLPMTLEFVAIAPKDQGVRVAQLIREPVAILERNLKDLKTKEGMKYVLLLAACILALNEFILTAGKAGGSRTQEML